MEFQLRLFAYLREQDVDFTIQHFASSPARVTGERLTAGQPEAPLVRSVLVFIDSQLAMLVIRDDQRVDPAFLRTALGRQDVTFVDSNRLSAAFPEVELPAIPPLGELWGIPVYVDSGLAREQAIRFYAGSREDIVTIRRSDFDRLAKPDTLEFVVPHDAGLNGQGLRVS